MKVLNDPDLAISILSQYVKGYGITNHILRDDLLAKIAELEVQPVENYGLIPVEQMVIPVDQKMGRIYQHGNE